MKAKQDGVDLLNENLTWRVNSLNEKLRNRAQKLVNIEAQNLSLESLLRENKILLHVKHSEYDSLQKKYENLRDR